MRPKHAEGVANCVDPEQTDHSGSTLFAYTCLSESFESLRGYVVFMFIGVFSGKCAFVLKI